MVRRIPLALAAFIMTAFLAVDPAWTSVSVGSDVFGATLPVALSIVEESTDVADSVGGAREEVIMTVTAKATQELAGAQFNILYDSSVVSVESVVAGMLPEGFLFAANAKEPGVIRIIIASATEARTDEIQISNITFRLDGNTGQSATLHLTNLLAADGSAQPLPVASFDGSIAIRDTPSR